MPRAALATVAALLALAPGGPVGAVSFIQDQDDRTANGDSVDLDVPNGVGQHDLLIAMVAYVPVAAADLTPPAGWTLLADTAGAGLSQATYTRLATASEPARYTWTYGSQTTLAAAIVAYEGVDSAQPVDASAAQANAASTAVDIPGVTTTVANTVVVSAYAVLDKGATLTPPAGSTQRVKDVHTKGTPPGVTLEISDRPQAAAGATGALAATSSVAAASVAHTLALRAPVVAFTSAASSAAESATPAQLGVTLSAPTGTDIDVAYLVTGGTATAADYSVPSSTVRVSAGATAATIPLTVVQDSVVEAQETVQVSLQPSASYALGATTAWTHTIVDDDTNYRFSASSATVVEGDGSITLTVERIGITTGAGTVAYATSSGSANQGSDFQAASGSLPFAAGESQRTFTVNVLDEAVAENDETFSVALSSPTGGTVGTPATVTVTLLDDDTVASVAPDPVAADGSPMPGARWGAWSVDPGAATSVAGVNYIKLTNTSNKQTQSVLIDFIPTVFRGVAAATETIPLDGQVQFAWWEDTTPGTTSPAEGTYTFLPASASGQVTPTFTSRGNVIYVTYQVNGLPAFLADQAYEAEYRIS